MSLLDQLVVRCNQTRKEFQNENMDIWETPHGLMAFQNNGGKLLAVAHTDWVLKTEAKFNESRTRIMCPQLDDRLGVFIILDLLREVFKRRNEKLPYDILLTDSEETGNSTAQYFYQEYFGNGKLNPEYNWMFEFDRNGTDAVHYDYRMSDWMEAMNQHFNVGWGSFSDIAALTDIGVCGINVGCGYHHEHTYNCYADLHETKKMVADFIKFYDHFGDQKFVYDPAKKTYRAWGSAASYDNEGYDDGTHNTTYVNDHFINHDASTSTEKTAQQDGYIMCDDCDMLTPEDHYHCLGCAAKLW